MNPKKLLGKKIKQIRKQRGFTQEKLAEIIGMDSGYICKMEIGLHTPSLETLAKLSKALNTELADFLDFENLIEQDYKSKLIELINVLPKDKQKQLYKVARALEG